MKTYTLVLIPFLSLSLSACIFNDDKENKETDNSSDKTTLATETSYLPKDGDQITFVNTYHITVDDQIADYGGYYKITTFSIINELPQKYGYQHHESGPFIQANAYKNRPNRESEATSVDYYSLTPSTELLIDHDLNDHYYSTIEFTDRTDTSSDSQDGLITEGEVVTSTKNNKIFNDVTGNEIGYETLVVTLTALSTEELTIEAGTFTAAKASYYAEQSTVINASLEDSSSQVSNGHYWFDSETGSNLKYSIEGTYTSHDNLERVIEIVSSSELVSSSEYETTLTAQQSATQRKISVPKQKASTTIDNIMKKTHQVSQEMANKISDANSFKF
mgnify:CR=1 FL=1